jgi:hypothetical protein
MPKATTDGGIGLENLVMSRNNAFNTESASHDTAADTLPIAASPDQN